MSLSIGTPDSNVLNNPPETPPDPSVPDREVMIRQNSQVLEQQLGQARNDRKADAKVSETLGVAKDKLVKSTDAETPGAANLKTNIETSIPDMGSSSALRQALEPLIDLLPAEPPTGAPGGAYSLEEMKDVALPNMSWSSSALNPVLTSLAVNDVENEISSLTAKTNESADKFKAYAKLVDHFFQKQDHGLTREMGSKLTPQATQAIHQAAMQVHGAYQMYLTSMKRTSRMDGNANADNNQADISDPNNEVPQIPSPVMVKLEDAASTLADGKCPALMDTDELCTLVMEQSFELEDKILGDQIGEMQANLQKKKQARDQETKMKQFQAQLSNDMQQEYDALVSSGQIDPSVKFDDYKAWRHVSWGDGVQMPDGSMMMPTPTLEQPMPAIPDNFKPGFANQKSSETPGALHTGVSSSEASFGLDSKQTTMLQDMYKKGGWDKQFPNFDDFLTQIVGLAPVGTDGTAIAMIVQNNEAIDAFLKSNQVKGPSGVTPSATVSFSQAVQDLMQLEAYKMLAATGADAPGISAAIAKFQKLVGQDVPGLSAADQQKLQAFETGTGYAPGAGDPPKALPDLIDGFLQSYKDNHCWKFDGGGYAYQENVNNDTSGNTFNKWNGLAGKDGLGQYGDSVEINGTTYSNNNGQINNYVAGAMYYHQGWCGFGSPERLNADPSQDPFAAALQTACQTTGASFDIRDQLPAAGAQSAPGATAPDDADGTQHSSDGPTGKKAWDVFKNESTSLRFNSDPTTLPASITPAPTTLTVSDSDIANWKSVQAQYDGFDATLGGLTINEDGSISGDLSALDQSADSRYYKLFLQKNGWLTPPPSATPDKSNGDTKGAAEATGKIIGNPANYNTGLPDDPLMQNNNTGTLDSYAAAIQSVDDQLQGLGDMSSMDMDKLQLEMDRRTKFLETLSNLIKKRSTTDEAIISNLK